MPEISSGTTTLALDISNCAICTFSDYRMLIGNFTLQGEPHQQLAPPVARSVQNYVFIPFDFSYVTYSLTVKWLLFFHILQVFFWSTSWPGTVQFIHHIFLHPISLLFTAYTHHIEACFAVVPKLCHLNLACLLTTNTQPFYSSLDSVWDNLGEPVAEKTFTHLHLSWSSVDLGVTWPSVIDWLGELSTD